ncbi:cold-regulated protein 27-like isoform X1 [Primulina tabacum]|uniref:cold-regulated protein 27-like isoform X1 n=1 Tax=Primulina tabacum TaxID=48773 RepID=UPI003F5A1A0E
MEGNCLPEMPSAPRGDFGCVNELTRSNLDTLAPNGEDILRRTAKALPDDCAQWTNEKHSSYLTHLEVSFVKHLHCSMDLLVQNSGKNQVDRNISRKRPANVQTAAEQFTVSRDGYCPSINNERDQPFSHVSSDTHNSLSSRCTDNFKCIQRYRQPLSADMHQFLKLHCMKKHNNGKVIVSPQLATCSKQFSACKPVKADSFHLMKEGMGQNFVDQDNSNNNSQAKRLKTALADCDTRNSIKQMTELF